MTKPWDGPRALAERVLAAKWGQTDATTLATAVLALIADYERLLAEKEQLVAEKVRPSAAHRAIAEALCTKAEAALGPLHPAEREHLVQAVAAALDERWNAAIEQAAKAVADRQAHLRATVAADPDQDGSHVTKQLAFTAGYLERVVNAVRALLRGAK